MVRTFASDIQCPIFHQFDDLAKAHAVVQKVCATGITDVVASLINQFDMADAIQVSALMRHLQIRDAPGVNLCFDNVEGASAHALASIVDWMSYLPVDCVKCMIRDGWHWTT
jgi:hypothetical protein